MGPGELVGAPRAFVPQHTLRKDEGFWIEAVGAEGAVAFEGLVNFVPEIVAGDADMCSDLQSSAAGIAIIGAACPR